MSFKFNPFTGTLDLVSSSVGSSTNNFSYNYIIINTTLIIPIYQQMVVAESLDIVGDIDLLGDLVII